MEYYKENQESIKNSVDIYNKLHDVFEKKNVSVECGLHTPMVGTNWVTLSGTEIKFSSEDIQLLLNAGSSSDITDVVSKTTGCVSLTFTFHDMTNIPEHILEKYQWLTMNSATLSIANMLTTIPLPNKLDKDTIGRYIYAIDSIIDENEGWDFKSTIIDEENIEFAFSCQYMQMIYGEDYYYYLVQNSKTAGFRYINEEEFEVYFVFGNK